MRKLLPLLALSLTCCALQPRITSPDELAVYAKCDPDRIAYWIDSRIEYHEQGPYWLPSGASMTLERADCKGKAQIALDTLNRCVGWQPRILSVRNVNTGARHAVVVATDHKGNRWAIDGNRARMFTNKVLWKDIVSVLSGGPWEEYK